MMYDARGPSEVSIAYGWRKLCSPMEGEGKVESGPYSALVIDFALRQRVTWSCLCHLESLDRRLFDPCASRRQNLNVCEFHTPFIFNDLNEHRKKVCLQRQRVLPRESGEAPGSGSEGDLLSRS